MKEKDATYKLRWHSAFLQAIQMELYDYKDFLEFKEEYQLNAEPLRIDLLIIKKPKALIIGKNIARIFRTDNVVEYKSPEDYLSVKDFWKVYAYANLYAAITPGIDLSDITLTFVGSRHPRTLLRYFIGVRGYTVEETSSGIYHVTGDYLPIQIIESKRLPEKENLWLESLRDGLKESTAQAIVDEEKRRDRKINIDAYMDVVVRANPRAFLEVQTMAKKKKETFEEVFTEAGLIPEWLERGRVQGREQGKAEGREEIARNLLAKGSSPEFVHETTGLPMETIARL